MSETQSVDAANDGFSPVEMVYAGRRDGQTGILIVLYDTTGSERLYAFDGKAVIKSFRSVPVGSVYLIEQKDSSFRFGQMKFLHRSTDPRVAGWKAADEAVAVAIRARKILAEEKASSNARLTDALLPFRHEYVKTDTIGRLALEVVLLRALRRGI